MTVPDVGITHDVVIYDGLGNIEPVGLIVRPFSYRVSTAPTFVPHMATGEPKGTDYEQTVSWVQDNFLGPHGIEISKPTGTNGYFRAVGMAPSLEDGRMYLSRAPVPIKISNFTLTGGYESLHHWGQYLTPKAVHVVSGDNSVSSGPYRIYSTNTRYVHGRCIFQPFVAGGDGTAPESLYDVQPYVKMVANTTLLGHAIGADVVCWSGVAFISRVSYTLESGVRTLIQQDNLYAHHHDTVWEPVGATTARHLAVYDNKLWRSNDNNFAYYDVEWDTLGNSTDGYDWGLERAWSDFYSVDAEQNIIGLQAFIGRLFIASPGALYAYEAGRTYKVADFAWNTRWSNFSIFKEIHGALWFNIGESLFRYTSGGLLEEMDTNFFPGGVPMSATAGPRCLYVVVVEDPFAAERSGRYVVYRLDVDTGAIQEILDGQSLEYLDSFIDNAQFLTDISSWTVERTEGSADDPNSIWEAEWSSQRQRRVGGSLSLSPVKPGIDTDWHTRTILMISDEADINGGDAYYARAYARAIPLHSRPVPGVSSGSKGGAVAPIGGGEVGGGQTELPLGHFRVGIGFFWYDSSHNRLSENIVWKTVGAGNWAKVAYQGTAPAAAEYARVLLVARVRFQDDPDLARMGYVYFDDILMEGEADVEDIFPIVDVAVPTAMEHSAPVLIGPVSTTFGADQGESYKGAAFLNLGNRVVLEGGDRAERVGPLATDESYQHGFVETPWIDYGRPKLGKNLMRLRVKTDLTSDQVLWAKYKLPNESWVHLGSYTGSNVIAGLIEAGFGAPQIITDQVKFRIGLIMSSVDRQPTPSIESIELDSKWAPIFGEKTRQRIQFNAIVVDNLELLSHTVENSAAWVIQSLNSLAGSGIIHTVALPYPPPYAHTTKAEVEFGPTGAIVPIMSHSTPSNAPGAEIGVVITEV